MASLSPKKWMQKHSKRMEAYADAAGLAVGSIHALQVGRIFTDGVSSTGGKIGKYNSTKPLYIHPYSSRKNIKTQGKSGQTKFKNGKPHKTGYFQSYAAYRRAMGLGSSFVNLNLTGLLEEDYTNSLTQQGMTWVTGTKNVANSKKLRNIFKKYGTSSFKLTESEKKLLPKIAISEAHRLIKQRGL